MLLFVEFGVIVISSKSGNNGLLLVGKLVKVNTLWKPFRVGNPVPFIVGLWYLINCYESWQRNIFYL